MVLWNIIVTDINTNMGVPNAGVYLFEGSGGVEPPENASFSATTDVNGIATFDVPATLYRVGVFASGYESAYDPHNPPAEWLSVWTCWGFGGAPYDYDFAVRYVGVPPLEVDLPVIAGAGLAIADAALIAAYLAKVSGLI